MLKPSRSPSQPSKSSFWGAAAPIAIAHRGGGAAYGKDKFRKENTLEAFANSVKLGYTYLEMDVINTADNRVVVVHVAKNKFEAKQGKKQGPDYQTLQKLTYQELKEYLGREVPTLEQVFSSFKRGKFFIDAKSDSVVEHLAEQIVRSGVGDRVCCGSFYPHRVLKLHKLLGGQIGYRQIISRSPAHLYSQWRSLKKLKGIISAVDLPYAFASRRNINYLHKKGLKVLVWTPNSRLEMLKSIKAGADGVITDNIKLLKEVLAEN